MNALPIFAAGGLLLLATRPATASQAVGGISTTLPAGDRVTLDRPGADFEPLDWTTIYADPIPSVFLPGGSDPNYGQGSIFEGDYPADDRAASNVSAFLAVLRDAEGTARAPDPYRVTFGYAVTLADLSDHPYFTGEWEGGTFAGNPATAAGAYQFVQKTWSGLKSAGVVWDFSPASQDAGAIELIRQRGALAAVQDGRISDALARGLNREWASLAPGVSGQSFKSADWIKDKFSGYGGTLA
ncbi:MAG: hypothetical protein ACREUQ_07395 [Burkholderiales bacterium]